MMKLFEQNMNGETQRTGTAIWFPLPERNPGLMIH